MLAKEKSVFSNGVSLDIYKPHLSINPMSGIRWPTQKKLIGGFVELFVSYYFVWTFLTLPVIWFVYYSFQFCIVVDFVLCMYVHVCAVLFLFVCLFFNSGWFAFLFVYLFSKGEVWSWMGGWGGVEDLGRDGGGETMIRLYCMTF